TIARINRERSIEILCVICRHAGGPGDPARAAIGGTPEEISCAEALYRRLMIDHAAISGAELGQTTIAAFDFGPKQRSRVQLRAVVLATTDDDVGVGRVQTDAFELDRVKVAVEIGPGRAGRNSQAIDAAIVAIEQQTVGIEINPVMINVRLHHYAGM